jgi:hypothetical protein
LSVDEAKTSWDTLQDMPGETAKVYIAGLFNRKVKRQEKQGTYEKVATYTNSVAQPEDTRAVIAFCRDKMNEGLYGHDLKVMLKTRFDVRTIKAAKAELKPVLAEQGLQGIYFLDPSVYRSCDEGAMKFRSSGIKYVKAMKRCESCVANSEGHCQKYNKPVVAEVPYLDRQAQQEAVLARNSTENAEPAELFTYSSMMDQFEMQGTILSNIQLDDQHSKPEEIEIEGGGMVLDWDDEK